MLERLIGDPSQLIEQIMNLSAEIKGNPIAT